MSGDESFTDHVSAIGPLSEAINGERRPRGYRRRRMRSKAVSPVRAVELDPDLRDQLVWMGVDMLCVEVRSPTDVTVHNSRDWR